ncbi:hypothetical protein NDNC_1110 [Candidatus Nasuia deltocephalinicola]|uniref:50S ribosomal protein L22 n=1 Tax=Candidatus Nasuia deltocephalincola TaxID=1160784 RepID=A0A974WLC7_9PROT|nr:hypothetical protein CU086_00285 [Candidatus Nasuia deltocephalinicola]BEH03945.1 hypothetical protein NDNC_1110 [Candidatus Nasuia deltocephalinicola]
MFFYYSFKNINVSLKKIKNFSYIILKFSNYLFEILFYLNFYFNKSSFILKKIFFYVLNDLKNKKKFFLNYYIDSLIFSKGNLYKRFNYRAKGKTDIILKKFCNIFLIIKI